MHKYKGVLLFDFDDTFVPKYVDEPSEANKKAIQILLRNDILPVITSGRIAHMMKGISNELGIQRCVFGSNCAIRMENNEISYMADIDIDTVGEILDDCIKHEVDFVINCESGIYYNDMNTNIKKVFSEKRAMYTDSGVNVQKFTKDVVEKLGKVFKVLMVFDDDMLEKNLKINMESKYSNHDKLCMASAHYCYLAIMKKDINKGIAVDFFREFNIPIVAIGDADNDIDMLKKADFSVAMGNSLEHIKQVCNWVTTDVKNDGFAHGVDYVIKEFFNKNS